MPVNSIILEENISRIPLFLELMTLTWSLFLMISFISSPSRAGLITGMNPSRWNINSYLQTKKGNREAEMADFLVVDAPALPRVMKEGGYQTAHIGKWHLGGGRDVKDVPGFANYGYDEYASTYESPDPDPLLTSTNWI